MKKDHDKIIKNLVKKGEEEFEKDISLRIEKEEVEKVFAGSAIALLFKFQNEQMNDLKAANKELYSKIEEINKVIHQPFDILQTTDEKLRKIRDDMAIMAKSICSADRQKECAKWFDKKNNVKSFFSRYASHILTVIITLLIGGLYEYIKTGFSKKGP